MTSTGSYVLWGSPHSYYTGKIRSYLIKKGVRYREEFAFHPQFQARILPAVRHFVVPILETPDGRILQDTTDMIEHIEKWLLIEALREHGNNKSATAKTLGITREGLHKKLKGYGIGASLLKTDTASLKAVVAKKIGTNPNQTINNTDSDGTDKSARIWIMGTVSF